MCGIVGIRAKNSQGYVNFDKLSSAVNTLHHRGPNVNGSKQYTNIALGHTRLSIIDTSDAANQPFDDDRYALVFNGEIYNYRELRKDLEKQGIRFQTKSDTEVLFRLLIEKRDKALEFINGCFAFAFYDRLDDYFLIVRDRLGIKPLYVYEDEAQLIFSSEFKTLLEFEIDKSLDKQSIANYFRNTYFPYHASLLKKVKQLKPGSFIEFIGGERKEKVYYKIKEKEKFQGTYDYATFELRNRLNKSVAKRLISDVPIGTFLSGGIDSTVISALAKYQHHHLNTFSVGFDHPYFDETKYAELAAKRIGSNHHTIHIGKKEFKENFHDFLNHLDEPFGDSSAFAVYLLTKYAKEHVTVCLSGDGADELFGGYRKHFGDWYVRNMSPGKERLVNLISWVLNPLNQSRSTIKGDRNRKIQKLQQGMQMSPSKRYYEWCTFVDENEKNKLLNFTSEVGYDFFYEQNFPWDFNDFNAVLIADQNTVLNADMLKKVDLMSMANAVEVRTPFLDHLVVDFVNSLPANFKVWEKGGKRLLKDCFNNEIPEEILNRPKKGFEIPIEEWLKEEIYEIFQGEMFQREFIEQQNLFNFNFIQELSKNPFSGNAPNRIYLVWSLVTFQFWYYQNFNG